MLCCTLSGILIVFLFGMLQDAFCHLPEENVIRRRHTFRGDNLLIYLSYISFWRSLGGKGELYWILRRLKKFKKIFKCVLYC